LKYLDQVARWSHAAYPRIDAGRDKKLE